MNLSPETREELKSKVTMSALPTAVKDRVLAILSQEIIIADDAAVIRELIQNELEADFAKVEGLNAELQQDAEYIAMVASHEKELADIEEGVKQSVEFVETQTAALHEMEQQLNDAQNALNIEAVKGRLQMG